jgi:radical SAM superfamily enzyme YgiQ (UPF0313 family)
LKILLIKPSGSVAEECCCGKRDNKILPAQMLLTAALLRQNGYSVQINDLQVQQKLNWKDFDICIFWICVIGTFFEEIPLVTEAKRTGAKTVVILNDAFCHEMEIMGRYPEIDFIIRLHEKELTILNLIEQISFPVPDFNFPGLIFRNNNDIVDTGEQSPRETLNHLGHCVEILKELPLERYDIGTVLVGKGCPFCCTYCSYQRTKPRKRNTEDILKEIQYLSKYFSSLILYDLHLPVNKKWALDFLNQLAQLRSGIQFSSDCRIENFHDKELLQSFKNANFIHLTVGIEHISAEIQKNINKEFTQDYIRKGVENCLEQNLLPFLCFMVGFPEESNTSIALLNKFITNKPFFLFDVTSVIIKKGTELHKNYIENNLIENQSLEATVYTAQKPPYHSKDLSAEDINRVTEELNAIKNSFSYRSSYLFYRLKNIFTSKHPFSCLLKTIRKKLL